jgi:hypothetical protein
MAGLTHHRFGAAGFHVAGMARMAGDREKAGRCEQADDKPGRPRMRKNHFKSSLNLVDEKSMAPRCHGAIDRIRRYLPSYQMR